ncbi:MAG TPA: universal stress protein [Jatrophihabitantaceae bacterium]
MSSYSTVVVGTDGSDTSLHAVDRAASLAADAGARLVIACAYFPANERETAHDRDVLGADAAYQVVGSAPAEDTLQTARDRAAARGAERVETKSVEGKPGDALKKLVAEAGADLLVVGNVGLNTLAGRILGSVPLEVARHAGCDVLIVHTS